MDIKEHINSEKTYIPNMNYVYPEDPNSPFIHPKIIRKVKIDKDYPFLPKTLKDKITNYLFYFVIFLLVFPAQKILFGLKIKGKENYRKNKKYFKNGGMSVSNHVYKWDFLACLQALKYRRMWFPARAIQFSSKDANLIKNVGGIPVPETISGIREFNKAFDTLHSKNKWIHFFPEAFRWDYFQPIRPFLKGAFTMAIKYDIPILPLAFSYREPTGIYKLMKIKHPLITLSIGTPVFPDKNLSKKENVTKMRNECHDQIVKMAGIEQNMYPAEAD